MSEENKWYASFLISLMILGGLGIVVFCWKIVPFLVILVGVVSALACLIRGVLWVFCV